MPTIHEVAREAEVSARTVSRVMNDSANVRHDTRIRVRAIAERMEYRPDPSARAEVRTQAGDRHPRERGLK
ncbi:MAG: hypothetical protein A2Z99_17325 [Treponema sp. GWB1_62_6]|nr:MAG: hypothetical protein A2Z99_17325 [Treponema sp. GWB1_62_6]